MLLCISLVLATTAGVFFDHTDAIRDRWKIIDTHRYTELMNLCKRFKQEQDKKREDRETYERIENARRNDLDAQPTIQTTNFGVHDHDV